MNKFINSIDFNNNKYYYYDLNEVFKYHPILQRLPNSLKVLLELNIRNADENQIDSIINIFVEKDNLEKIEFYPSRIIMQDFSGIPAMVDFASMRDAMFIQNKDVNLVNPQITVDLIIDNSLNSDTSNVYSNLEKEITRNKERYKFAKWAQNKFKNFSVIPPGRGISQQINLEYLSTMLSSSKIDDNIFLFPESIIGTDSHTTMINALGVLGWGVNTLELESAMLGSSISLYLPKVVGVNIIGSLAQGVSINDAVLTLTNILKEHNVKEKIVEFYGLGLKNISLEDRATLSNKAPEYGAICAYFTIDDNTISFVEQTRGVNASLIKTYYERQGMYSGVTVLDYDEYLEFDLSLIKPIISGPKKIETKVYVDELPSLLETFKKGNFINDNDIVLATITSCTSTSNPILLIQAALLAKKACELGLKININIKRSLTPGSLIVKEYLKELGLLKYLEKLGFDIIGFDCTSDCEEQEELVERVSLDIDKFFLNVCSLTSSDKNFQESIHPKVKSNWLMSPALVIAYCLKGSMNFDITKEAIIQDIYLSDIWPSMNEVNEYVSKLDYKIYKEVYKDIFIGSKSWQELEYKNTDTYSWDENSTYIQACEIFEDINLDNIEISNAKIIAIFADNISSDYLSPIGQIPPYSPAALYLQSKGLKPDTFNSFGNRRGNSEVMVRGILSSINIQNKMVKPKEGGYTKDFVNNEIMSFYDFSLRMKEENTALIIFAGHNYGIGPYREWAAKGTRLLGVKVVVAKSFDEKHKINLIKMGILPLEFIDEDSESLNLKGDEIITIKTEELKVNEKIQMEIRKNDEVSIITLQSKLENKKEILYYKNGGILPFLLKSII